MAVFDHRLGCPTQRAQKETVPWAEVPRRVPFSSISTCLTSPPFLPTIVLLLFVLLAQTRELNAESTNKCYSFSPGLTIIGADYRRDFGLSRRQCADVCKSDVCCMAFEWRRAGGQCTLKSRSLNGTVVNLNGALSEEENDQQEAGEHQPRGLGKSGDLFFALCLDYGDSERDRFWDHELGGSVVASINSVEREKCVELCGKFRAAAASATDEKTEGKRGSYSPLAENNSLFRGKLARREKRVANARLLDEEKAAPAVIYSWRTPDEMDMESPLGHCECISVLQHIQLSFGSFAGFLI